MSISGVSSREEALTFVQIGVPITYAGDFEYLINELVTGRVIDYRIGGIINAQAGIQHGGATHPFSVRMIENVVGDR